VYEKNLLVQAAPAGDFDARTRLLFQPTSNYQIAGIVLHQNDENFLVLGRAFCDAGFCVGNGIYFDWVEGGTPGGQAGVLAVANPSEAYLRVVRQGNTYSGYYSPNGSTWTLVGSHIPGAGVDYSRVGVAAGQDQAHIGRNADFDWFRFE
jgi:beta-xylosidase